MSRSPDYEVGYGRPPKHTRFKRGQSGNPAGRPRGSRNLSMLLKAELEKRVAVKEGGQVRRVPKREALIASLVNRALQGDARAMNLLLGVMQRIEPEAPDTLPEGNGLGADDQAIIEAFLRARQTGADDGA